MTNNGCLFKTFFFANPEKAWPCIPLQRVLKKVAIDAAKGQVVLLVFTQAQLFNNH